MVITFYDLLKRDFVSIVAEKKSNNTGKIGLCLSFLPRPDSLGYKDVTPTGFWDFLSFTIILFHPTLLKKIFLGITI
jgi:hypothetical protein